METRSKIILIGVLLFCLTGCHLVTKEEVEGKNLPPSPNIVPTRDLIVLPTQFNNKVDEDRYILAITTINNDIYNYMQFLNSMPATYSNTPVTNEKDIFDFYKVENPTPEKRAQLLEETMTKSKINWLKARPDKAKEVLKRFTLPETLGINVKTGDKTPIEYFDRGDLVAQTTIDENSNIHFFVYDPISDKNIVDWQEKLPNMTRENLQTIENIIKNKMKETLSKISGKNMYEAYLVNKTNDIAVFIDNKLVITPSLFLEKGYHTIFFTQLGKIVKRGMIHIIQNGKIDLNSKSFTKEGFDIKINTKPKNAALFINEQYIGLTPVEIKLPEGINFVRASAAGYSHINYSLNMQKDKPVKELTLLLSSEDAKYIRTLNAIKAGKVATFFSGIGFLGAFIYSIERANFYQQQIDNNSNLEVARSREALFKGLTYGFAAASIGLFTTALVLQVLEVRMENVGIGIDQDKNLGVKISF